MRNLWKDDEVTDASPLAQLVYQSRLVGREESLVLWGGGNNSIKVTSQDLVGAPLPVMFIKGSGSDMKTISEPQFPAVRLDYVLPLRHRAEMSDEEMVDYLARCLLDPKSPRPSIETLLHAFLPESAVLHTHADAILTITNNAGREQTVRECFGDSVITVPYLRPGFALSRLVGEARERAMSARGLVLMNHGLLTWGATPKEAYERHIELVSEAERFVEAHRKPSGAAKAAGSLIEDRIAPIIRGSIGSGTGTILQLDSSEKTLRFLARPDLPSVIAAGAATPDHMLHTRRRPMIVELPEGTTDAEVRETLNSTLEAYRHDCAEQFERCGTGGQSAATLPRIVLIPGVGFWAAGKDVRQATVIRDIYLHTIDIVEGATGLGGYESLNDQDAFDGEYWPLELYKLSLLPKEKELARRVVVVTGAATGIGRAIAVRFASEGAHVAVTDLDTAGALDVAGEISSREGSGRAIAVRMDVSDPSSVELAFRSVVLEWGGVDIVVSNAGIGVIGPVETLPLADWQRSLDINTTGHFHVVRKSLEIFRRQGTGGNLIFIASKNVTSPGKDFGAYSVSKAAEAQLCRIVAIEGAEIGVRANMLNPDAVFDSRFWSGEIGAQRAAVYGIETGQLAEFYRTRNLLKRSVTAADVAEAALFFASERSSKTTGAMLPVDGGIREAFPR